MRSFATVEIIVGPPGEPSTIRSLPCLVTMVGDMAESGRLPGAIALFGPWMRPNPLGTPTLLVKSSISSFMAKPRPLMTTPDPKEKLSV